MARIEARRTIVAGQSLKHRFSYVNVKRLSTPPLTCGFIEPLNG